MNKLNGWKSRLETALAEAAIITAPANLYEPIKYILNLGGKRIRPILCLIACDMFGGEWSQAVPSALGVEYFHNFSLMHDDVMDDAPLRRGKTTVHEKYNLNTAILSGDAMLIKAYEYFCKVPTAHLAEIIGLFNQTALEVCEGQQYDMDFETTDNVTIPQYLKMIELKTAVLIATSLKMGAIVGGASAEDAANLYEFGRHIGIAFQLQDDWLDAYADQATFGKQVGGDIIQNKKTYLLIKALELADEQQRTSLETWLHKPDADPVEKVQAVTAIFNQTGVSEVLQAHTKQYYDQAFAYLNKISLPDGQKQALLDVTDMLMYRQV